MSRMPKNIYNGVECAETNNCVEINIFRQVHGHISLPDILIIIVRFDLENPGSTWWRIREVLLIEEYI